MPPFMTMSLLTFGNLLVVIYVVFSHLTGLFNAFDENRDNHIDFKEISCGLSACCRGPLAERQKCKCIKPYHKICRLYRLKKKSVFTNIKNHLWIKACIFITLANSKLMCFYWGHCDSLIIFFFAVE